MKPDEVRVAGVFERWRVFGLDKAGQARGRVPQAWREIIRRDPMMREVTMVVDIVFGAPADSLNLRVATRPVSQVSSRDGADYSALPLLIDEPELKQEYAFGQGTSSARSIALSLDGRFVDAARLVKLGSVLAGFAEVSLQVPGGDYEDRYVLLRGDVTNVRYGSTRELVELEVVDPKESIGTILPPWVIASARNPTAHITATGERYPVLKNSFQAIPARRLTNNTNGQQTFVYAAGSGFAPLNVFVNGVARATNDAFYAWNGVVLTDQYGVTFSAVRFTRNNTVWADNDAVHVEAATTGEVATTVQSLREILRDYTPLGEPGLNAELFASADGRFPVPDPPQVLVNAGGSSSGTGMQWAESTFLDSFPMLSMVWENGSYGPVLTDFRLPPVAHWTVGQLPLLDRDTMITETGKNAVFNSFVVRYDYDALLDVYQGVVSADPSTSDLCARSEASSGPMAMDPLESPYITSASVATYVLDWLVEHYTVPSQLVEYVAAPWVFLEHRRGDIIAITDAELGWQEEPVSIEAMTYRRGQCCVARRVWIRSPDMGAAYRSRST